MLNAREKLREGIFGDTQHLHPGVAYQYQMSRPTPNQVISSTLGSFKLKEKVCASYTIYFHMHKHDAFQDHRPIAVNVQTLTDYHSDADYMKSYSSVTSVKV